MNINPERNDDSDIIQSTQQRRNLIFDENSATDNILLNEEWEDNTDSDIFQQQ